MSAAASPAPAAPIRVAAGTTAGAAVRDAGLPSRGAPDAVVVVRDADGRLRDLSWVPDTDAEVTPVTMAKALVRAGLAVPAELLHIPVAIEPRKVPIGQQWVDAPAGPDDPRLPEMVARLTRLLQTAAPGSDVAR